MNKNGLIYLPHTEESFPTPRTRQNAFHPTKPLVIYEPKNFKRAESRLKATGQLDSHDFSSAAELGMFIDFHNDTVKKAKDKWAHNEIVEIAKFLAKSRIFIPDSSRALKSEDKTSSLLL